MIIVFLFLTALFVILWRSFYRHAWSRNLTLTLHFAAPYAYAGNEVSLIETIENRKRIPVPILEAGFRIPKGVLFQEEENTQTSDYIYKRDIFALLGRERIVRTHTLSCEKRGLYSFSQITLVSWSLLHDRKYILKTDCQDQLYVYAKRVDISRLLPPLEAILGQRESARKTLEDPFSFSGIRAYTPQDPLKTVNWKATARTGSLMVNTYSSVQSWEVFLILDVSDPFIVKQDLLAEASVSIAATVCDALLRQNFPVGLCVNAQTEGSLSSPPAPFLLPPGRGREQLHRIEQFLTQDFTRLPLTGFDHPSLAEAIARQQKEALYQRPVFLFISKNAGPALLETFSQILGKQNQGLWVIPHRQGESISLSSRGNLVLLPYPVL